MLVKISQIFLDIFNFYTYIVLKFGVVVVLVKDFDKRIQKIGIESKFGFFLFSILYKIYRSIKEWFVK